MARETRRQRRDARRASGEQPASRQGAQPAAAAGGAGGSAGGGVTAVGGYEERRRRGGFVRESWAELKKVDWPTRNQTVQGTIVVIIACAVVGAYLWGLDQVLQPFVRDVLLGG
jgi:preprotein translocase SecE subunit